ncbi:MAG: hypothetical protein WA021_04990 [Minisyncoccia bacterium]
MLPQECLCVLTTGSETMTVKTEKSETESKHKDCVIEPANEGNCSAWSSRPTINFGGCAKMRCKSPWRKCVECVREDRGKRSQVAINPDTGLCKKHGGVAAEPEDEKLDKRQREIDDIITAIKTGKNLTLWAEIQYIERLIDEFSLERGFIAQELRREYIWVNNRANFRSKLSSQAFAFLNDSLPVTRRLGYGQAMVVQKAPKQRQEAFVKQVIAGNLSALKAEQLLPRYRSY